MAGWVFLAVEDAGTLDDVHTQTLVIQGLVWGTVASLHTAGLAVRLSQGGARALARVRTHVIHLATCARDLCNNQMRVR